MQVTIFLPVCAQINLKVVPQLLRPSIISYNEFVLTVHDIWSSSHINFWQMVGWNFSLNCLLSDWLVIHFHTTFSLMASFEWHHWHSWYEQRFIFCIRSTLLPFILLGDIVKIMKLFHHAQLGLVSGVSWKRFYSVRIYHWISKRAIDFMNFLLILNNHFYNLL